MLGLGPIGMAAVPLGGDESDVTVKRWVLKLMVPVLVVCIGFVWHKVDDRFAALEHAPSSNTQVQVHEQRLEKIEKIIEFYERLRSQRDSQIAQLQEQTKFLKELLQDANGKLDRLLYRRLPQTGNDE